MNQLMSSFMDVNLPYVSLLVGVVASLMLYVATLYQVQKLRCSLVFCRRRVEGLEGQLSALGGKGHSRRAEAAAAACERALEIAATPGDTQRKVLHLHGLGRSNEEIARQTGIREAEVDFVLKVSELVGEAGGGAWLSEK